MKILWNVCYEIVLWIIYKLYEMYENVSIIKAFYHYHQKCECVNMCEVWIMCDIWSVWCVELKNNCSCNVPAFPIRFHMWSATLLLSYSATAATLSVYTGTLQVLKRCVFCSVVLCSVVVHDCLYSHWSK